MTEPSAEISVSDVTLMTTLGILPGFRRSNSATADGSGLSFIIMSSDDKTHRCDVGNLVALRISVSTL